MNKKVLGGIFLILVVIIAGSYFANNATFKGSFNNLNNLNTIKNLANQQQTPADYGVTKLTVYLPPELAKTAIKTNPLQDDSSSSEAIAQGNVSTDFNSNEKEFYLVRAIVQNLGTTTASLPKVEALLNQNNISNISGMVKFGKVSQQGMEVIIRIPTGSSYLLGNNTLTINLDSDNTITEARKDNNSASVRF